MEIACPFVFNCAAVLLRDQLLYLVCLDVLNLVEELLSRDGRGSPNHIYLLHGAESFLIS